MNEFVALVLGATVMLMPWVVLWVDFDSVARVDVDRRRSARRNHIAMMACTLPIFAIFCIAASRAGWWASAVVGIVLCFAGMRAIRRARAWWIIAYKPVDQWHYEDAMRVINHYLDASYEVRLRQFSSLNASEDLRVRQLEMYMVPTTGRDATPANANKKRVGVDLTFAFTMRRTFANGNLRTFFGIVLGNDPSSAISLKPYDRDPLGYKLTVYPGAGRRKREVMLN